MVVSLSLLSCLCLLCGNFATNNRRLGCTKALQVMDVWMHDLGVREWISERKGESENEFFAGCPRRLIRNKHSTEI